MPHREAGLVHGTWAISVQVDGYVGFPDSAMDLVIWKGNTMSVGTIVLIILVILLLGGFSGYGGGPFYGTGYYGGGGLGLVILILLILILTGNL